MKTKGMIIGVFVLSSFLYGCSGESGASDDAALTEQLNLQADSLEKVNEDLEQTQMDLKKSTEEVDQLLKDL